MRSILKAVLLFSLCVFNVASMASFAPPAFPNMAPYSSAENYCSTQQARFTSQSCTPGSSYTSYDYGSRYACAAPNCGYYAIFDSPPAGSCGPNATNTSGSCDCNAGYSENAAHNACEPVAATPTSPHGSTAPIGPDGPLGPAPIFGAASLASGMLGVVGAIVGAGAWPVTLLGAGAFASGMIAAPGWFGGFSSPSTPKGALEQGGVPMDVRLETPMPAGGETSGGSAGVGQSADGRFVPAGGGVFSGNGATGGWQTGGATGEWTYTPPAIPNSPAPSPILVIKDGGYTMATVAHTNSAGATTAAVVAKVFDDKSLMVTEARTVPVVTSDGTNTTAAVSVATSYNAQGIRVPGSTVATVGTTLGNGTATPTATGVPGGAASGSGTAHEVGDGFAITGAGSGYSGATAGTGTGGTGTGNGGPMKIDEAGTPAPWAADKFNELADAYKNQGADQLGQIAGDRQFFGGWGTFFTAPAIATCQGFTLPRDMGEINPCPVVDGVRSIMALLWSVGGLLLCIKMVREVI